MNFVFFLNIFVSLQVLLLELGGQKRRSVCSSQVNGEEPSAQRSQVRNKELNNSAALVLLGFQALLLTGVWSSPFL